MKGSVMSLNSKPAKLAKYVTAHIIVMNQRGTIKENYKPIMAI